MKNIHKKILKSVSADELWGYLLDERWDSFLLNDNKFMYEYVMKNIEDRCSIIYDFPHGDIQLKRKKLYESFRRMISLDLTYSTLATYAYCKKRSILPRLEFDLPYKEGIVNLNETFLIDAPYQDDKWQKHLFRKNELNNELIKEDIPSYYPSLNFTIIGDGNKHRIAEAYLNKRPAAVKMKIMDDADLLNNVYTDGESWINNNGYIFDSVKNYKLALIYTLKQKEMRS